MTLNIKVKKFLFFWTIINIIGYTSFLTGFTPSFKDNTDNYEFFLLTPRYETHTIGNQEINEIDSRCNKCNFSESENFWPFHKFTFTVYQEDWPDYILMDQGFIGIWGYYGHYEFIVYILIPFLFIGLRFIYFKLFSN